ncbi:unknown [Sutterella wadsworthensis CAG:135]|nr:unknown [Sutterella wadsworthensis CAG:135]
MIAITIAFESDTFIACTKNSYINAKITNRLLLPNPVTKLFEMFGYWYFKELRIRISSCTNFLF